MGVRLAARAGDRCAVPALLRAAGNHSDADSDEPELGSDRAEIVRDVSASGAGAAAARQPRRRGALVRLQRSGGLARHRDAGSLAKGGVRPAAPGSRRPHQCLGTRRPRSGAGRQHRRSGRRGAARQGHHLRPQRRLAGLDHPRRSGAARGRRLACRTGDPFRRGERPSHPAGRDRRRSARSTRKASASARSAPRSRISRMPGARPRRSKARSGTSCPVRCRRC